MFQQFSHKNATKLNRLCDTVNLKVSFKYSAIVNLSALAWALQLIPLSVTLFHPFTK